MRYFSSLFGLILLLSQTTFACRTGSSLIKTGMTLHQVKDTIERHDIDDYCILQEYEKTFLQKQDVQTHVKKESNTSVNNDVNGAAPDQSNVTIHNTYKTYVKLHEHTTRQYTDVLVDKGPNHYMYLLTFAETDSDKKSTKGYHVSEITLLTITQLDEKGGYLTKGQKNKKSMAHFSLKHDKERLLNKTNGHNKMSYIQFFYGKPAMITGKRTQDQHLDASNVNSNVTHERITTAYHHYYNADDHIILVFKGQILNDLIIESKRFS